MLVSRSPPSLARARCCRAAIGLVPVCGEPETNLVTNSRRRRTARRALHVRSSALPIAVRVLLVLPLLPAPVHAQDVHPPRAEAGRAIDAVRAAVRPPTDSTIRLGDLYAEVVRANPRTAAADAEVRAARARVAPAGRPPDPMLQLGWMNYRIPSLRPMDPLGMTQLQLMQRVPVAGKLALAGAVARAQADATAARADNVPWELRSRVAVAFYEVYQTDQALLVAEDTQRLLQNIASIAEAMYRVGDAQQSDVLRAQVEIARLTEDIVRMRAMRTGAAGRLNALLDRDPDATVGAAVLPRFPDVVPSLDSLNRLARSNRPMLRAGEHDVRAADAATQLARREIWPDLEVGVQYGQRAMTGGTGGTERMGSLMIGASLPIFASHRQLQMREEADAMRRAAAAELATMRAETRGELGDAYANLVRARNLAALYRTTVLPQAQATVTSALASYRVGRVNFMTLLDDQMTVNRYRQELFALEGDEGNAWAALEMLTGQALMDPYITATTSRDAVVGGESR